MNIQLSIITPCHNSIHLMNRMLEIFAKWRDKNIEWVLVDDCSHDATVVKLIEFKKNNPELNIVIVENKTNSGPGVSRNNGIEIAKGEYLTFLDSDDFFEEDFIKTIKPLLDADYDCIIFDAYLYYNEKSKRCWSMFQCDQDEGKISTTEALLNIRPGTWGKIYKKEIIKLNDITFLNQRIAEDVPFTISAISKSNNIYYVKKPLYNYVQQPNSITHSIGDADPINARNAFHYIEKQIENAYPCLTEYFYVTMYLKSLALLNISTLSKKDYIASLKTAEQEYPNYYKNIYLKKGPLLIRLIAFMIRYKLYNLMKIMVLVKNLRDKRLFSK